MPKSLIFFYHFKLLLWIENQTAEINTAPVYFHCQVYMTKVTGEDIFKACTNVRILGEDLLPVSFSRGVRRFLHWVDLKASDCWGGREVGEWDNSHTVPLPYLLGPQSLQGLSVPALPGLLLLPHLWYSALYHWQLFLSLTKLKVSWKLALFYVSSYENQNNQLSLEGSPQC